MSLELIKNIDGSVTFKTSEYDFTQDIKGVFRHCNYCDTTSSYAARVKMMNGIMNLAIEIARGKK